MNNDTIPQIGWGILCMQLILSQYKKVTQKVHWQMELKGKFILV